MARAMDDISTRRRPVSEKILFVDDDANILEAYRRQLRKQFTIETALGGEEGLEAARSQGPFAVVVSDLRMPGMDGIQFLSSARLASPGGVPRISALPGRPDAGRTPRDRS